MDQGDDQGKPLLTDDPENRRSGSKKKKTNFKYMSNPKFNAAINQEGSSMDSTEPSL